MFLSSLLLAAALAPQGPTGTAQTLVINEFSYDDASTDDVEFVEIYNASGAPIDLTGWSIGFSDPNGVRTPIALSSVILAAGDYYVVGNPAVPNVDQIAAAGFLQNDNESLTLFDPSSAVIDTLIYEANKGISFNPALAEGEGIWDNHTMAETSANAMSLSRVLDGYDTNDNGRDFVQIPWTPGTSNNKFGNTYADNYDSLAIGADAPGWAGNFKNARAIDPTVVGPLLGANNLNPNAIPASPQGGNAVICWDETGGGNFTTLSGSPGIECSFDGYVYLAPTPVVVAGQAESWSIGINGTCNGTVNIPDPSGVLGAGFIANGNTGFSWIYTAEIGGAALYLVDNNNGGWGGTALSNATVLATIPISSGTNDGWQRLKISTSGTTLEARFGGTPGNADGTLYSFTVSPFLGNVYIGYREIVTANNTLRPITLDDVRVSTCSSTASFKFGHGTPGTLGVPGIDQTAAFALNSLGTVGMSNMLPSDSCILLIGFQSAPVDLTPLGAQAGSELYLFILTYVGVPTDGSGNGSYGLFVPPTTDLCGAELSFQAVQVDSGIPTSLPISTTMGLTVRIGL